jgi:hypothetical protein
MVLYDLHHFMEGSNGGVLYRNKKRYMELNISSDRTIGQLQDEFATYFPHLKPVFFSKPHDAYKGSPAKFIVSDRETTLSSIAKKIHAFTHLLLEPEMPVWQLERLFELEYGLHVQIFRRSGNTWLETSVTDDLTLEQQEAKALSSLHVNFEFVDPMDYREQD